METFVPDYQNLVDAAWNRPAKRLPLYEHQINQSRIEAALGTEFSALYQGDDSELLEYYRNYCAFFLKMGYDCVSFEQCLGNVLPGGGALGGHIKGVIQNRSDFNAYPWEELEELYFTIKTRHFNAMRQCLPEGMRIVGGVGNGVFECVQELVGYMDLCYISADDPQLYRDLFDKIGETLHRIWARFLCEFHDIIAVCRMGDDLGYKSDTMISHTDIRELVLPQYKRIVELAHSYNKPFLLHSCGNLLAVMDDIIRISGINAKHSNEDQIAPFTQWVDRFGAQIGNFGGIDTGVLCRLDRAEMREYIFDTLRQCEGKGGIAFGSGNSIPDYVPIENYLNMIELAREYRGA